MAATQGGKHVVFDIVGTCVSYDAFFAAIESRLGDRLRAQGILPRLFGYAWMECAEREFAYLDISGRYRPFWEVFQPLFYRILWMSGVADPRGFADDEDAAFMVQAYRGLQARPGIQQCWARLREEGFTVWALTTGDTKRVKGYLESSGLQIPEGNFVSCDDMQVRKPAPESYRFLLDKFQGADETWFAAAHIWDASAAKANGYVFSLV